MWSPDGEEILFASDGQGKPYSCVQDATQAALWAVGSDGGNLRRVLALAKRDLPDRLKPTYFEPQDWSRDGRTILYMKDRYSYNECLENYHEGFTLRSVPARGSARSRKVIEWAGWGATLSPDGRSLAFTEDGREGCDLIVADSADLRPRRRLLTWLDAHTGDSCAFNAPTYDFAWSPVGELMVIDNQGLFGFDPVKNRKRRIVRARGLSFVSGVSSDGNYLTVRSGKWLLLVAADGSQTWRVTAAEGIADVVLH